MRTLDCLLPKPCPSASFFSSVVYLFGPALPFGWTSELNSYKSRLSFGANLDLLCLDMLIDETSFYLFVEDCRWSNCFLLLRDRASWVVLPLLFWYTFIMSSGILVIAIDWLVGLIYYVIVISSTWSGRLIIFGGWKEALASFDYSDSPLNPPPDDLLWLRKLFLNSWFFDWTPNVDCNFEDISKGLC